MFVDILFVETTLRSGALNQGDRLPLASPAKTKVFVKKCLDHGESSQSIGFFEASLRMLYSSESSPKLSPACRVLRTFTRKVPGCQRLNMIHNMCYRHKSMEGAGTSLHKGKPAFSLGSGASREQVRPGTARCCHV